MGCAGCMARKNQYSSRKKGRDQVCFHARDTPLRERGSGNGVKRIQRLAKAPKRESGCYAQLLESFCIRSSASWILAREFT